MRSCVRLRHCHSALRLTGSRAAATDTQKHELLKLPLPLHCHCHWTSWYWHALARSDQPSLATPVMSPPVRRAVERTVRHRSCGPRSVLHCRRRRALHALTATMGSQGPDAGWAAVTVHSESQRAQRAQAGGSAPIAESHHQAGHGLGSVQPAV